MTDFSRRRVLQAGLALGALGTLPRLTEASEEHSSPELGTFVQPLPIPEVREPDGKQKGAPYHEIPMREFSQQLHPDLPETTLWGFDGLFPGPILEARRGERLRIRFDNSELPSEHLLSADERLHGTSSANYPGYDGPVPEVRTVTHFHGLKIPTESDGQADMWTSPVGETGPRHTRDVHEVPNRQVRTTTTYYDHARGVSRLNNYAGLVGPYYLRSAREERLDLPEGDYDVQLVLLDRSFEVDGSLHYPESFEANVAGDSTPPLPYYGHERCDSGTVDTAEGRPIRDLSVAGSARNQTYVFKCPAMGLFTGNMQKIFGR
ncbi:hypothetical protein QA599_14785 [Haloarculaceae archaeon H-GB1-1]|nr:hypothetical protein [Haloarculaceae archaeon H-GB1-1]